MDNVFVQLAIILALSSVIGFIVLKLKLPLVIAYLLTGVALSALNVFGSHGSSLLHTLPEIGIAFILFLIGMELDLRELRLLGKPIIATSVGQIAISTSVGFGVARSLGFPAAESVYIGLGLAFASTVVIIKLLLEKRDLASLYGKLSVGILLIEDLVAIGAIMFISVGNSSLNLGFQDSLPLLTLAAKALGLILAAVILSKYVLEKIFDAVAKSVELLFFTAITWCFLFTSLAVLAGFSVVIGAFVAGVALASSAYHLQIQGKIRPLRDFFLALFFVYLGSQVRMDDLLTAWPMVLIFTAFALILKPIACMSVLGLFGFRKHTLFQTSINVSQISEFSLIILLVGIQYGVASQLGLSVMAAAAVLSIIISSILITYSDQIYKIVKHLIPFADRRSRLNSLHGKTEQQLQDHVVVVGADKVGGVVVDYLQKQKVPMIVLDFNPHIIHRLREKGVNVIYGDLSDPEIIDLLQLETARLVISTASGIVDNEMLLAGCKEKKTKATIVVRTLDKEHEQILKDMGADYVIQPERVSGDFLVSQLKSHWPDLKFK